MKTINTPEGKRNIPDWAEKGCMCVKNHRPMYVHTYPFALYNGAELWLCPNTYHQATTLLKIYQKLNGPPATPILCDFGYFPRGLIEMYWYQVLEAQDEYESYEAWKADQVVDDGSTDYFEEVKKHNV